MMSIDSRRAKTAEVRARPRAAPGPFPRRKSLAPGRNPVHPGYFLDTRYLKPLKITQHGLAQALGISRRRVNELIRGHRGISADTAVRLAMYFGNEPAFWMELQSAWDIHEALKRLKSAKNRAG